MHRFRLILKFWIFLIVLTVICTSCSYKRSLTARNIELLPYYASNMVFERDKPIVIKGRCDAGGVLGVRIEKLFKRVIADKNGYWEVSFEPVDYKGPFNIYIEGAEESVKLNNIVAGKLWILIGDSWMENDLESTELNLYSGLSNNRVRYFQPALGGIRIMVPENCWKTVLPGNIKMYEALSRILGDDFADNEPLAIGIINLSLPGINFIEFSDSIPERFTIPENVNIDSIWHQYYSEIQTQRRIADSSFRGIERGVLDLHDDDSDWGEIDFPVVTGTRWYLKNRVIWLRKKFYVSEKYKTGKFKIDFGRLRGDFDFYINGSRIDRFKGETENFSFVIPDTLIRTWTNLITVRMVTSDTLSGFYSGNVTVVNEDSTFYRNIAKDWKFRTYFEPQIPEVKRTDYIFPHLKEQLLPLIRISGADGVIVAGSYNMFRYVSEKQIESGLKFLDMNFKPENKYLCLLPAQSYVDSLLNYTQHRKKQTELLHASAVTGYTLINLTDIKLNLSNRLMFNSISARIAESVKEK